VWQTATLVSDIDGAPRGIPFQLSAAASISSRVRLARHAANLEPEAVAAALGISRSSYFRSEAGVRPFKRGELLAIAGLTGQSPELFGLSWQVPDGDCA
jgi:transcriptional regulator with XRE-family HTH domain